MSRSSFSSLSRLLPCLFVFLNVFAAENAPRFRLENLPAHAPAVPAESASAEARQFARLLKQGSFKEAVALAEPLAARGDAEGHFLLAYAAEHPGAGLKPDLLNAASHYREAAKAEHLPSQVNLAALLLRQNPASDEAAWILNSVVDRDPRLAGFYLGIASLTGANGHPNVDHAVDLWTRSGRAGNAAAWRHLGFLHQGTFGIAGAGDDAKAFSAFQEAARLGDGESCVRLGVITLQEGAKKGRKPDEVLAEANQWFDKGSAAGQPAGLYLLGQVREQGLPPLPADPAAAKEAYQKAAGLGHEPSMVRLGRMIATAGDAKAAQALFQRAADLGSGEAWHQLALQSAAGHDPAATFQLFLKAGLHDHVPAASHVGEAYRSGRGVPADPFAAMTWFSRAAELGDTDAMVSLAEMMLSAEAMSFNPALLDQLTRRAFNAGNPRAGLLIARMAERGIGTPKNLPLALALYRWSAARQQPEASSAAEALAKAITPEQLKSAENVDVKGGLPMPES